MINIVLTIDRDAVYEEVEQTTSYTGAKLADEDPKAYDRMMTTEADRSQLLRFWNESRVTVCQTLKKYLEDVDMADNTLSLLLKLSDSFDETLTESINTELFSFFVMSITAKWYVFTNKREAGEYATAAASMLEGIHRKLCFKKRPKRPTFGPDITVDPK